MERIIIYWNYLELFFFGGTWNGIGTEWVPIKNQVERIGMSSSSELDGMERNKFQKKLERSTTKSAFIPVLSHQEKSNGADSSVTLN